MPGFVARFKRTEVSYATISLEARDADDAWEQAERILKGPLILDWEETDNLPDEEVVEVEASGGGP